MYIRKQIYLHIYTSTSVASTSAPAAAAAREHSPVPAPISSTRTPRRGSRETRRARGTAAGQKQEASASWVGGGTQFDSETKKRQMEA